MHVHQDFVVYIVKTYAQTVRMDRIVNKNAFVKMVPIVAQKLDNVFVRPVGRDIDAIDHVTMDIMERIVP